MRIGIDIDNVTQEFQQHWIRLYEEWFALPVDPDLQDSWDCLVSGTHFASKPEFFDWYDGIRGWETQPLVPGAGGAIDYLQPRHQLVFVTSRHTDAACLAARNFLERSPWKTTVQLRVKSGNKVGVPTSINVDDDPAVARAFEENQRQLVLFDQPWNQNIKDSKFIHRAHGWHEVIEAIGEYGS